MGRTLVNNRQDLNIVYRINALEEAINEMRSNQNSKLIFIDITVDGTGSKGKISIGSSANAANYIYIQSRTGGLIDFYNKSNVRIASLDSNGNLKTLGTITPSTSP